MSSESYWSDVRDADLVELAVNLLSGSVESNPGIPSQCPVERESVDCQEDQLMTSLPPEEQQGDELTLVVQVPEKVETEPEIENPDLEMMPVCPSSATQSELGATAVEAINSDDEERLFDRLHDSWIRNSITGKMNAFLSEMEAQNNRYLADVVPVIGVEQMPPNLPNVAEPQPQHSATTNVRQDNSMEASTSYKVTPISELSSLKHEAIILATVVSKTDLCSWSNAEGAGIYFSVELADKTGRIKATCFGADARKYHKAVQVNRRYFMGKFIIKPVNPNFKGCGHGYELHFRSYTMVERCNEPEEFGLVSRLRKCLAVAQRNAANLKENRRLGLAIAHERLIVERIEKTYGQTLIHGTCCEHRLIFACCAPGCESIKIGDVLEADFSDDTKYVVINEDIILVYPHVDNMN